MLEDPLKKICVAIGYEFKDMALLSAALTHRSHASEHAQLRGGTRRFGADNERLEFLGDAVLSLVIAEALWTRVPNAHEGSLSRMRAAIVNEAALAAAASAAYVGEGLRLGRGESRSGGRTRPSMLADALEAVFAAVYLDGGIAAAQGVVMRALGARLAEVVSGGALDHKSTLQEMLQARHKITPRYAVVATFGPDHDREHEVELQAGDVVSARGRGRSKKEAEQAAARLALDELEARDAHDGRGAASETGSERATREEGDE